jgi:hypothetical protein
VGVGGLSDRVPPCQRPPVGQLQCAVTRLVIRDYFNHVPIRRVMRVDQLRCVSRDTGHEAVSVTCHGIWREPAGPFSVYVHFRWGV